MNIVDSNQKPERKGQPGFRPVYLVAGLVLLLWQSVSAQDFTLPDNPLTGRFVFEQKGCITCHAIKGAGGDVAPDLGDERFYGSFLDLASIMWNHSPEMLRRMRELDLPYPEFSQNEMAELTAYLYYLRYLGEPGDLYRGKLLVREKLCLTCHSIGGKGGKVGPAFDKLAKYVSPLYMAQALWNHGPEMDKQIRKKGLQRPEFRKGEIVDLSAYIRSASKGVQKERVYMSPGNPQRGEKVFEQKGCLKCHSLGERGGDIGPNLQDVEWDYSVTEIAGLMWNHATAMGEVMEEHNITWPKLSGKEMADLIAYLYFLKFTDQPGDPQIGKRIFTEKGCAKCHGESGTGGDIGPDLSNSNATSSAINLAQFMWNHAPIMEERILERAMRWPEFTGTEMRHLYAFLKSLRKTR